MSIVIHIGRVQASCEHLREEIEKITREVLATNERVNKKCEEMRGKWTDDYIGEYKRQNLADVASYRPQLQRLRDKYRPTIKGALDGIDKEVDSFFKAPVDSGFANKINTIFLAGISLNDTELNLLESEADSYLERRLVTAVMEKSGKKASGKADIPNIKRVYSAVEDHRKAAERFLETYCGSNAELNKANAEDRFGNVPSEIVSMTADSYLRNKHSKILEDVLTSEGIIKPAAGRELSPYEKQLIDLVIDPKSAAKYPSLVRDRVIEVAKLPEMAELLANDNRYSSYLLK